MPTRIIVPLLGEGVEEVTIVKWLKNEGETIEEYDGLVEVETDKVVTEIPSPVTGTILKIITPKEGQNVPVGDVLAWVGKPGETIPDQEGGLLEAQALAPEVSPEQSKAEQPTTQIHTTTPSTHADESPRVAASIRPGRDPDFGFISPLVAKIASEENIDLAQITGTGLDGRITKQDVLAYIETGPKIKQVTGKPTARPATPAPPIPSSILERGELVPLSSIRKRIAEHMIMSKRTSAHVTTLMEADMSHVVAHRKTHKPDFAKQGARLTFTAYFVAAAVEALKAHPMVNASWTDQGILLHPDINIGMATDLGEEGLIVPVIKQAASLSLLGIARAVNDLANRARAKNLQPADVQGATFSITNHGVTGSLMATPIINQPQVAILGVGTMKKNVVAITDEFNNDTIAIRPMIFLTLTFDHRVLDGASADRFLGKVVEKLENW